MKRQFLNKDIIGADETGVGDYLSPLVVAAVFVPHQNVLKLVKAGVTDSKKISDPKILRLFAQIKPYIKSSVRYLTQVQYNQMNKTFNAHELKTFLHLKAISAVEKRVQNVDFVILDQYASMPNMKKYYDHLQQTKPLIDWPQTNLILLEKAELAHVAVAAASIVARAYLLQLMTAQARLWNCVFPLGTNAIVEQFAYTFVKQHGRANLGKIAKLKFKTTAKLFD